MDTTYHPPHIISRWLWGGGGLGEFQPLIFSKETAVSVGLRSQQGKANNTKEVGQRALRKMEGFKIILEGREGLGGKEGGKRKGRRLVWQPGAHMWPSFAYVASLQGEGLCKHKQQRGCSWSKEAAACLLRPLHGKQWIKWRTGLWQCNRDPGSSEKNTFPLYVYISAASIFTPLGNIQFSIPFVLKATKNRRVPSIPKRPLRKESGRSGAVLC